MKVFIDRMSNDELDPAIQLLKALYLELGEEKESVEYLDKNLIAKIIDTGITEIYLVKDIRQKVIGIMTLTEGQSIYAGGKYGLLDEMYVRPEFRSDNIGTEMVEKMKRIGLQKKWKRIDVTAPTEERWKRTVAFYERSGFLFTGPKLKLKL
jgi:GNAT superfamily N-acetyltransferase